MMVSIKRLQLTNFKSFRHLDFEMKPLNILIGPNGAGKSNLISFFKMMAGAADKQLASYVFGAAGLDQLRWKGATSKDSVEWKLDFEGASEPNLQYSGKLTQVGSTFMVADEELSREPYLMGKDRWKFLLRQNGRLVMLNPRRGQPDGDSPSTFEERNDSATELILAQRQQSIFDELRDTLKDWTIFRGFGERALENIHQTQQIELVTPLRLKADGSNLASVLQVLTADYVDFKEDLYDTLQLAFPNFTDLVIRPAGTGRVELQWRTKNRWQFPAQSLSDGMLRFIGLATLLNLPELPPLIAIDEPEVGLHPRLIPLLAGMLRIAARRTQLIVTTHSPELLNAPDIELEDIVLVNNERGETTLNRVTTDEYLEMWLRKYSDQFGRLWVMGKLR